MLPLSTRRASRGVINKDAPQQRVSSVRSRILLFIFLIATLIDATSSAPVAGHPLIPMNDDVHEGSIERANVSSSHTESSAKGLVRLKTQDAAKRALRGHKPLLRGNKEATRLLRTDNVTRTAAVRLTRTENVTNMVVARPRVVADLTSTGPTAVIPAPELDTTMSHCICQPDPVEAGSLTSCRDGCSGFSFLQCEEANCPRRWYGCRPKSTVFGLDHLTDEDCWGRDPTFCGEAGACCRQGFEGSPVECGFGLLGCADHHCCVKADGDAAPTNITVQLQEEDEKCSNIHELDECHKQGCDWASLPNEAPQRCGCKRDVDGDCACKDKDFKGCHEDAKCEWLLPATSTCANKEGTSSEFDCSSLGGLLLYDDCLQRTECEFIGTDSQKPRCSVEPDMATPERIAECKGYQDFHYECTTAGQSVDWFFGTRTGTPYCKWSGPLSMCSDDADCREFIPDTFTSVKEVLCANPTLMFLCSMDAPDPYRSGHPTCNNGCGPFDICNRGGIGSRAWAQTCSCADYSSRGTGTCNAGKAGHCASEGQVCKGSAANTGNHFLNAIIESNVCPMEGLYCSITKADEKTKLSGGWYPGIAVKDATAATVTVVIQVAVGIAAAASAVYSIYTANVAMRAAAASARLIFASRRRALFLEQLLQVAGDNALAGFGEGASQRSLSVVSRAASTLFELGQEPLVEAESLGIYVKGPSFMNEGDLLAVSNSQGERPGAIAVQRVFQQDLPAESMSSQIVENNEAMYSNFDLKSKQVRATVNRLGVDGAESLDPFSKKVSQDHLQENLQNLESFVNGLKDQRAGDLKKVGQAIYEFGDTIKQMNPLESQEFASAYKEQMAETFQKAGIDAPTLASDVVTDLDNPLAPEVSSANLKSNKQELVALRRRMWKLEEAADKGWQAEQTSAIDSTMQKMKSMNRDDAIKFAREWTGQFDSPPGLSLMTTEDSKTALTRNQQLLAQLTRDLGDDPQAADFATAFEQLSTKKEEMLAADEEAFYNMFRKSRLGGRDLVLSPQEEAALSQEEKDVLQFEQTLKKMAGRYIEDDWPSASTLRKPEESLYYLDEFVETRNKGVKK